VSCFQDAPADTVASCSANDASLAWWAIALVAVGGLGLLCCCCACACALTDGEVFNLCFCLMRARGFVTACARVHACVCVHAAGVLQRTLGLVRSLRGVRLRALRLLLLLA
jgi:hypothetical protein